MARYTVGEALELLLGDDESGGETNNEEDPEFSLPTVDSDSLEEREEEGWWL